jgi:ATP-binding cassette subfamily B protein/subfamily B ATP-binding cassette protein MsbA
VNARIRLTVQQTMFSLVLNLITALGTAVGALVRCAPGDLGKLTIGQLLVVLAYVAAGLPAAHRHQQHHRLACSRS